MSKQCTPFVERMSVLVFSPRSISHSKAGGAERYLHEIVTRIKGKGVKLLVISSTDRRGGHKIANYPEHIVARKELFLPISLVRCMKIAMQFDLYIENVSKFPTIWPLIFSKLFSKPLLVIVHHVHSRILFKELPWPIALLLYVYEILSLKIYSLFTTLVITVSESSRKELIKLGFPREKIVIIPPGHFSKESMVCSSNSKAEYPLVVYVGRVKRYKRVDELVKAMSIIKTVIPSVRYVIAGNGDHDVYRDLKELAKKLGLDKDIEFKEAISEEEKVRYLERAWVYVMTSMKEGFGISALEAQACGTPVVGYRIPGLIDSVRDGETGFLVPDGDRVALAKAVLRILTDKELREEMSRKAKLFASNYSWESSAEKFLKLVSELAHSMLSKRVG